MRCAPVLLLLIGNLVAFDPAPTELLAHAGTQKTAYAVVAGVNDDADSLEDDSKDLNTGAEDASAEEDADPAGEDSLDAADTSSQDSAFEEAYSPDTTGNDSLDDDSLNEDSSGVEPFVAIPPVDMFTADSALLFPEEGITDTAMPEELRRPIRVGILPGVSRADIGGGDSVLVSFNGEPFETHSPDITVSRSGGKVTFRDASGFHRSADSLTIAPADTGEASRLSVSHKKYRGALTAILVRGHLTIVNDVNVEDYVKGVIPYEIGRLGESFIDALKAQAVAARTYAYHHYNSRRSQGFDVYPNVRDQVYNGIAGESTWSNAAVDSTAGVVLTYEGKFIEAYYHSTCGGHTDNVDTWGVRPAPYLRAVPDLQPNRRPWCSGSNYSHWTWKISDKEMTKVIRKNFSKKSSKSKFKTIKSISVRGRLAGGRVRAVTVETDKGSLTIRGDKTRWMFRRGSRILPSSRFSISKSGNSWVIHGTGFGHGIGMCQMGARARAQAGQDYKEILEHYYPAITLMRLVP